MQRIITMAKLRERKKQLDDKVKEKQLLITMNDIHDYHELLTILEKSSDTSELIMLEYLMTRLQKPRKKELSEFETYKDLREYRFSLDHRLRDNQITKADLYEYHKLLTIEERMQKIRNEINDSYWLAILKNMMEEYSKREYKVVNITRYTKAKRDNKLIDVTLRYPFIVPKEFNENTLTANDIVDAGEIARSFFERGIVIYFDNNCQIGLPLEIMNKYDEFVFNIFKSSYKEKNTTVVRKRFH